MKREDERERKAMQAGSEFSGGLDRGAPLEFKELGILEVAIVRFDSPPDP
jgi:hypothetical protein